MEYLVKDIINLPSEVTEALALVREYDKKTRDASKIYSEEQKALIEELNAMTKVDPDFDEAPFKAKFDSIIERRHETLTLLEMQMKSVQNTYDKIDGRILSLDNETKTISHLIPQTSYDGSLKERNKKKKKKRESISDNNSSFFDTNEPLYCTCKQVSYGQMIGCENTDCPIEWFHFPCVGITVEPEDPWYCNICKPTDIVEDVVAKMKEDNGEDRVNEEGINET